jgi:hypothetical protein
MNKGIFFAIALYFFITLAFVWPMPLEPNNLLAAKYGDATGAVWDLWIFNNYDSTTPVTDLVNYPEGMDFSGTAMLPFIKYVLIPTTKLTSPIFAYNLFIFLAFFLSAISMFFLARHFLKDNVSSFVSGLIFGFSPYVVMKVSGHLALANLAFVAFFVLALFRFKDKPSFLRAGILGTSLFVVSFFETYYFYFCILFLAIFSLFYLWKLAVEFLHNNRKQALGKISLFVIPGIVALIAFLVLFFFIVFPLLFPGVKNFDSGLGAQGLRGSLYNVIYFSAKPSQFIIPPVYNPVLGGIAVNEIPKIASADFGEGTLYIGISVLLLALLAAWKCRKERPAAFFVFAIIAVLALIQGPLLRYINVFGIFIAFFPLMLALWLFYIGKSRLAKIFIVITALLVLVPLLYGFLPVLQQTAYSLTHIEQLKSASPEKIIAYLERFDYFPIPMPSLLLYKLVPFFRVYERLIVLLMLCLAVLAGFGVKKILSLQKGSGKRLLTAGIICAIVLFEFASFPPAKVTQMLPMPAEYDWLSQQPSGTVVAEYPLSMFSYYAFYQQFHKKKLFNSQDLGNGLAGKEKFIYLSQETVNGLKAKGINFIIVHSDSSRFFSQNFADQKFFQKKYDSSKEAVEISSFIQEKKYNAFEGLRLEKVFGKTFVFKIE